MKRRDSGKFGINMKQFCRGHEAQARAALAAGEADRRLLEKHMEKLRWLQHERLIHLIVTVMTVLAELTAVCLTLCLPEIAIVSVWVVLLLAVLLGFYFYHYFFLENAVQRWYLLAEQMMDAAAQEKRGSGRHE